MATVPPSTLAAPYASASLYVGDLQQDVTEARLFEIFNAVGPVASVRVCRDAATRRSLGYAYVNFHRVEDAERALDTMNFKNIRSRPCRIMWSHRDPSLRKSGVGNIFVKNLARSIDNKSLYDTFSMFGNILSCKVATNSKRESLGYGFVHYESEEAAQSAIERVNGKVIAGECVTVSAFKSKKERGGGNRSRFTNVYVNNLPENFTQEKLDELFGKYGKITSSLCVRDEKKDKPRTFGFVNFAEPESAAAAVEALSNTELEEGSKLYVGRAQRKEEREKELRERFEQLKLERQRKFAGVNLYVKNLHDEIDDDRLLQEFAKFGAITSHKVMVDQQTGKSKGFGFVCFSTPEEATKAVTEMNGEHIAGKPLYVALAQRKALRRAQLEAKHAARVKLGVPQPQMFPPQAPMYFQGMPQNMRFAYPQQMAPRQGYPAGRGPGPDPVMMYRPTLVPLGANGRGGGVRGGGRRKPQGQPGGGRGGRQGGQNFKYADNVRNRDQQPRGPPGQGMPPQAAVGPDAVVAPTGGPDEGPAPLSLKELAAAPEEQQKQMIGERLFPLIKARQPEQAGKITGMLLEMDNGELINLLESHQDLNEKIREALEVLEKHNEDDVPPVEQQA
mmetsp:Transcript_8534/g.9666  ORF Transcript_8534/g.9666 Transcript_8534/m.9666 type:complete len:618 (-) Transcript_8534:306-2159(-)|eukprot:CAMPEP_0205823706 /NCGR_PEP_ID=MMETSP0206-20130828/17736_1 /ASSEMBLY_ACC=CAM_ASM_000279 /TAXON_ID=36767 /ORGANISM="Euplotes focardii, Strain TN1" /LENGTH=617 /DNA_ID=CAMNT_0053121131 /DNA_START=106 /DNA_END=1959 /DNA_ORIENTATION=-